MSTRIKTLSHGSIAGLALIFLVANPSFANTNSEKATSNQASGTSQRTELVKQLLNQRTTPQNQPSPQTNQMGCACCQSMMNNKKTNSMPGMMHNMPEMMDGQNK